MKVQVRFRVWVFIESFSLRMSRHLGQFASVPAANKTVTMELNNWTADFSHVVLHSPRLSLSTSRLLEVQR